MTMTTTKAKYHVIIESLSGRLRGMTVLAVDAFDAAAREVADLEPEVGDTLLAYAINDRSTSVRWVYGPIPELDGEIGWSEA